MNFSSFAWIFGLAIVGYFIYKFIASDHFM